MNNRNRELPMEREGCKHLEDIEENCCLDFIHRGFDIKICLKQYSHGENTPPLLMYSCASDGEIDEVVDWLHAELERIRIRAKEAIRRPVELFPKDD